MTRRDVVCVRIVDLSYVMKLGKMYISCSIVRSLMVMADYWMSALKWMAECRNDEDERRVGLIV